MSNLIPGDALLPCKGIAAANPAASRSEDDRFESFGVSRTRHASFQKLRARQSTTGRGRALAQVLTCLLGIGCANPGPPRPPSLHLPALVADLAAERTGNRVILRWTTPSRTTDDLPATGAMMAQICREAGPRPGTPAARLTACAPILRLAVAPGPSQVADTLSAALVSGPAVLLSYRIQIFNSVERSAGDSTAAAFAASGAAPPPIESLNVTASEHGAVLEWAPSATASGDLVELTRTDLSTPPATVKPQKTAKPRPGGRSKSPPPAKPSPESPDRTHLRTPEIAKNGIAGTVDATAAFGETYTYTGERVRLVSIGSHRLEVHSDTSSPVTIAMRDTFPPRAPAGLATIPGTGNGTPHGNAAPSNAAGPSSSAAPYIDLSWEPNTEPDLAGYFVYRQLASQNGDPQGQFVRLTVSPVTIPAYRDVAVSPGRRYIYWITAVDASGNESAPSAKAQEAVSPE